MKKKDIKILLVDDEQDILEIVGYNLSQEGYQIVTASNGKEADRSSRVSKLKACLNLVENTLAKAGPMSVYVRIKGPDGILLTSEQQRMFSLNGEQMIYSASREVDYQGQEVEICIYFTPLEKLKKGVYQVDAYTEQGKLGSSDMLLK